MHRNEKDPEVVQRKPKAQIYTQTKVEEHQCQTLKGHRLYANNCGLFDSPATMNFCTKCYDVIHLKEQEKMSTKSPIEITFFSSEKPLLSTLLILLVKEGTAN
ncbi:Zinc finger A20 and AN1 domain-containing stress-associated protein 4 [Spatholobus suberectus]|nr:Zinc finger A20 and AN1 domain-containing stress-associated protein 4 [Spatholobus suberectus]